MIILVVFFMMKVFLEGKLTLGPSTLKRPGLENNGFGGIILTKASFEKYLRRKIDKAYLLFSK